MLGALSLERVTRLKLTPARFHFRVPLFLGCNLGNTGVGGGGAEVQAHPQTFYLVKSGQNHLKSGQHLWKFGQNV